MPELPEVETVRRGLTNLIVGRRISGVTILKPKSFQIDPVVLSEEVVGARVTLIRRYAKLLSIDLSTDWSLAVHLKMTGQLVFRDDVDAAENWGAGHPTASFLAQLPDNSTRVVFDLTGCEGAGLSSCAKSQDPGLVPGSVVSSSCAQSQDPGVVSDPDTPNLTPYHLFFNDQRIFGWVRAMPSTDVQQLDFVTKLGPEPLTPDGKRLTGAAATRAATDFLARVRHHTSAVVKAAILDQTVIAGVGNIYADEALWAARTHPSSRVKDLTDARLKKIFVEAGEAMARSLESGGSTMRDYIQADGTPGSYLDKFANVFRREGQPCPRCGAPIEKIRVAGRGTHICPRCQRVAKPR